MGNDWITDLSDFDGVLLETCIADVQDARRQDHVHTQSYACKTSVVCNPQWAQLFWF